MLQCVSEKEQEKGAETNINKSGLVLRSERESSNQQREAQEAQQLPFRIWTELGNVLEQCPPIRI